MAGQASSEPAWTQEDWAALGTFMHAFNKELLDSGELLETRGLSTPVHSRRGGSRDETAAEYATNTERQRYPHRQIARLQAPT